MMLFFASHVQNSIISIKKKKNVWSAHMKSSWRKAHWRNWSYTSIKLGKKVIVDIRIVVCEIMKRLCNVWRTWLRFIALPGLLVGLKKLRMLFCCSYCLLLLLLLLLLQHKLVRCLFCRHWQLKLLASMMSMQFLDGWRILSDSWLHSLHYGLLLPVLLLSPEDVAQIPLGSYVESSSVWEPSSLTSSLTSCRSSNPTSCSGFKHSNQIFKRWSSIEKPLKESMHQGQSFFHAPLSHNIHSSPSVLHKPNGIFDVKLRTYYVFLQFNDIRGICGSLEILHGNVTFLTKIARGSLVVMRIHLVEASVHLLQQWIGIWQKESHYFVRMNVHSGGRMHRRINKRCKILVRQILAFAVKLLLGCKAWPAVVSKNGTCHPSPLVAASVPRKKLLL